jgi:hypothetical protein
MPIPPEQEGGDHGLSLLGDAWDKTTQYWRDDMARHFGTYHLTPLLQESRSYLDALSKMIDLLNSAEHDTEY